MKKCFGVKTVLLVVVMLITSSHHVFAGRSTAPFLWRKSIGPIEFNPNFPGNQSDKINRIELAKDGGTYVVGSTSKSYFLGGADEVASVVKTDAIGNVVWSRTYNLLPLANPYCISSECKNETKNESSLTGVRLVEKSGGRATLVTTNYLGLGTFARALVLIDLDAMGNEIGRNEIKAAPGYSGDGSAWISEVLPSPDGNLVMIGGTRSSDLVTKESYAAKIDQAGNLIWFANLGHGEMWQEGVLLDDGAVAIWSMLANSVVAGTGNFVYHLDIVDTDGVVLRAEQVQAPYFAEMAPTSDGGYLSFRQANSVDETLAYPDKYTKQVAVTHVSSAGTVDWSHTFTFPGQQNWSNRLEIMSDGSALLKGGGACAAGPGTEFSAIRVAPHGSASWAGGFVDCDNTAGTIFPDLTAVQWAPDGGFLFSGVQKTDLFIGLLPATPQSGAVSVAIDIQPSSITNTVNTKRDSLLPVAIWSKPGFNAPDIDLSTLTLAGAPVLLKKTGYAATVQDLNRDGLADLRVDIPVSRLSVSLGANRVTLQGTLCNGVVITGEDNLIIR